VERIQRSTFNSGLDSQYAGERPAHFRLIADTPQIRGGPSRREHVKPLAMTKKKILKKQAVKKEIKKPQKKSASAAKARLPVKAKATTSTKNSAKKSVKNSAKKSPTLNSRIKKVVQIDALDQILLNMAQKPYDKILKQIEMGKQRINEERRLALKLGMRILNKAKKVRDSLISPSKNA